MKNTTKAVVAGGVGVALLLGGAGTIAFWTDTEDGAAATVQAGTLELGTATGAGWELRHVGDGTGTPTAWASYTTGDQIVPGDQLRLMQTVPVTLQGEAIAAQFTGDVTVTSTDTAGADLAAALGNDPALTISTLTGASENFTFDDDTDTVRGEGAGSVAVTTTVAFPWGEANDFDTTKLASLEYAVDYTLTQIPGTTTPPL